MDCTSFTTEDQCFVKSNSAQATFLVSAHEPADAAEWIEHNWDGSVLASIRGSGCYGPLACMLSPQEPALALFGWNDPRITAMAQELAEVSGFPVMIRPPSDNPALSALIQHANGSDEGSPAPLGVDNGSSNSNNVSGDGRDASVGAGDNAGPNNSRSDSSDASGEANGGGDGGDGSGEPSVMDERPPPLHRTSLKLRIKLAHGVYNVAVVYAYKFIVDGDPETPIDHKDFSKPLSRPELISLVDFKIEARPREAQVDRSYASIGFVAHRGQSFADRQFLPRGFEQPEKTYTYGIYHGTQWGLKAAAGFSQGSPLGTVGLSYDENNNTTTQAADNKAMPKCLVKWEEGEEWGDEEDADESYSSYNISFQPREVCFSSTRNSEPLPLEVKVGMGVNFRSAPSGQPPLPPVSFVNRNQVLMWISDPSSKAQIRGILVLISSYLDDVHTTEKLQIFEQKEVEFDVTPQASSGGPYAHFHVENLG
ncbi:hypothetical protein FB45DRAFT_1035728 [Roridomyces roridus]|uniref:Uncharacterized protein n=1 Tax=Roridomyces roridus TaxID=1738132 RepID=A0AAD7BAE7_9AGAR|nr:hypothetical protein FB45DRAFT_1035728 [Roridomyces roridus]